MIWINPHYYGYAMRMESKNTFVYFVYMNKSEGIFWNHTPKKTVGSKNDDTNVRTIHTQASIKSIQLLNTSLISVCYDKKKVE